MNLKEQLEIQKMYGSSKKVVPGDEPAAQKPKKRRKKMTKAD